jgi:hypothetical protein
MAESRQFIEYASGAAANLTALASIPSGADNAILRVDSGTVRWAETTGSWVNASIGLLLSGADPPFRIGGNVPLTAFRFVPVGGAGAVQVSYYTYRGIGQFL